MNMKINEYVGLAISGGADSMALAYLCRQWERQKQTQARGVNVNSNDGDEASVTAFVVDHKAREESTQEANTVASWLRELGACFNLSAPIQSVVVEPS